MNTDLLRPSRHPHCPLEPSKSLLSAGTTTGSATTSHLYSNGCAITSVSHHRIWAEVALSAHSLCPLSRAEPCACVFTTV